VNWFTLASHSLRVGGAFPALPAALECVQEAGAEAIVHLDQLRVAVGALLVTRLRQRRLVVLYGGRPGGLPLVADIDAPDDAESICGCRSPYARGRGIS